jgi:hypothetical protein
MGRGEVEREFLQRFSADESKPLMERVRAVLILHQRLDSRACGCGWNQLGAIHAEHQAQALQEAGLLKEANDA